MLHLQVTSQPPLNVLTTKAVTRGKEDYGMTYYNNILHNIYLLMVRASCYITYP